MSFQVDFAHCLSPFPTPAALITGAFDVAPALSRIWRAWADTGASASMLLQTLVSVGAVAGIDEAALAAAGSITVVAYIARCAACCVSAAGPAIWNTIEVTTGSDDQYVHNQLILAANNAGVQPVS